MLRFLGLALLAGAMVAGGARATTHSTDYTDLWYLPAESGWGVNVVQQHDTVFATFFVYGQDGSPRWFVAPETRSLSSPPGQNAFIGPLFETNGTFYGIPWAGTGNRQVGNVTFNFTTPTTGTVTYNVDSVSVTRTLIRQTWGANSLAGNYLGGTTAVGSNCGANDGLILIFGELTVGHSNFFRPTFRVDFRSNAGQPGVCIYTGNYLQEGKMGSVTGGTFNCEIQGVSNPPVGTFELREIEANRKGINARFTGADQFCQYEGFFGGLRDVI